MKFINLHLNGQRQIDNYFIFFDHACSIAQVCCTRIFATVGAHANNS